MYVCIIAGDVLLMVTSGRNDLPQIFPMCHYENRRDGVRTAINSPILIDLYYYWYKIPGILLIHLCILHFNYPGYDVALTIIYPLGEGVYNIILSIMIRKYAKRRL